jgi:hypothetical protein
MDQSASYPPPEIAEFSIIYEKFQTTTRKVTASGQVTIRVKETLKKSVHVSGSLETVARVSVWIAAKVSSGLGALRTGVSKVFAAPAPSEPPKSGAWRAR